MSDDANISEVMAANEAKWQDFMSRQLCSRCGASLLFDGDGVDEYGPHTRWVCSANCVEVPK